MAKYLLGIDLGTSSVRAGLYHEDGTCLLVSSRIYPIETPSPTYAEQNPEVWWKNTCEAIAECLNNSKIKGADITGISFSGQMHGTVLLDGENKLISPSIIWADKRSADLCVELSEQIGNNHLETILMNRIFPGTQLATIAWIQQHEKELWERTQRILLPKDYIRFRMCGLFHTEPSDASGTLLCDIGKREWSKSIIDTLKIPVEYLPFIVNSDQVIGETGGIEDTTGIPDGIPIIVGGADQPCTALGNGILDEGQMLITIGTGGQIFAPLHQLKSSSELALNTFCHLPESRWYVMGATLSAGLSLRWYRDTFCSGMNFHDLTIEATQIPPGADGLIFIPYLAGRRSPTFKPNATGAFIGVRLNHTRAHFVRAIMEGVVFELKENLEIMKTMELIPSTIVCTGGAVRSALWIQILADILGYPLNLSFQEESACFGAALISGIGTGVYRDYNDAAEQVQKPEKIIEPTKERIQIYTEKFELFKEKTINT
jgi:xylulokinase